MELSDEILGSIVWSLAATVPSSQDSGKQARGRLRLPAHAQATIHLTAPYTTRTVSVWDVSADGVSILSPEPIAIDDHFILSLPRDGKPLAIVCRVTHCSRDPQRFRIGAQFLGFA
jgi:hypothetical protein